MLRFNIVEKSFNKSLQNSSIFFIRKHLVKIGEQPKKQAIVSLEFVRLKS